MDWDLAGRLALSAFLSGVIGLERAWRGKPAGLRTHLLVGMGSTLIMLVSIHMTTLAPGLPVDPSRIASNVVAGLGFLGAGTIMHSKGSVQGLTTAASLWATGAIGLAVGCGYDSAAIYAWIGMGIALHGLDRFEREFIDHLGPRLKRWMRRRRPGDD